MSLNFCTEIQPLSLHYFDQASVFHEGRIAGNKTSRAQYRGTNDRWRAFSSRSPLIRWQTLKFRGIFTPRDVFVSALKWVRLQHFQFFKSSENTRLEVPAQWKRKRVRLFQGQRKFILHVPEAYRDLTRDYVLFLDCWMMLWYQKPSCNISSSQREKNRGRQIKRRLRSIKRGRYCLIWCDMVKYCVKKTQTPSFFPLIFPFIFLPFLSLLNWGGRKLSYNDLQMCKNVTQNM